jgi:hypothetical protein
MVYTDEDQIRLRDRQMTRIAVLFALAGAVMVVGCSDSKLVEYSYPERSGPSGGQRNPYENPYDSRKTVFGDGGLLGGNLLNLGRSGEGGGGGGGGIGVNSYLWRATLDTLAFMPLASADPFGGVIITDWYSPPETPTDRFKMTVYILDRQLRADGLKVAAFRQIRSGDQWADAAISPETTGNLENAILRRARQLRSDVAQQ